MMSNHASARSARPPAWSEVTAFFGGTFDPPHLGHREAVLGLFENPGVAHVRVIPAAVAPLRAENTAAETTAASASVASAEDRLALARLAFPPEVVVDRRELERARTAPHVPSYTYDTLMDLGRELPARKMAWVIGTDQLLKLPQWHRFPDILRLCHWIILERKESSANEDRDTVLKGLAALAEGPWGLRRTGGSERSLISPESETWISVVPTPARSLSATRIRESLAKTGKPPENALDPLVWAELKRRGLYGTSRE